MTETVDCDEPVTCRLTVTLTAECPVRPETDYYEVTVKWEPNGKTYEKHTLKAHVESYEGKQMTQEQLASEIASDLDRDGIETTVTVRDTEHIDMVVIA